MDVNEMKQPNETALDCCWRVERAENFALIVDACDYFQHLRKVITGAKHQLLMIGWDFDLEIEMLPGESDEEGLAPDGLPNKLGPFLEEIIERTPDLHIHILKWNGSILVAPGRLLPTAALAVFGSERIHFALDSHHPFGACHHQKIVVADDLIAFCGGIDATESRWDTSEHLPDDPRRVRKDGTPAGPWHDATSAISGPAAVALGDLSRKRWNRACGETIERPAQLISTHWPDDLEVDASDIEVGIARTEPPFEGAPLVNEIEDTFLHGINKACQSIYIESQYFASETICAAIEARLAEADGPEVIVINPLSAMSAFEDDAMHELRDRMKERFDAADHENRFRLFYPVTKEEQPIYVHAKIMIIDAAILNIGSANMNNRSMGFDTECNVIVEGQNALISKMQARLLSEHLSATVESFAEIFTQEGTLRSTIDTLNAPYGRGLREIGERQTNFRSDLLADTRLMDPRYHPGEISTAGKGVRPRHIVLLAGAALLGYLGWSAWRRER